MMVIRRVVVVVLIIIIVSIERDVDAAGPEIRFDEGAGTLRDWLPRSGGRIAGGGGR